MGAASGSVNHHRTDAFAGMHQIEALVDILQLQHMGDHRVDLDFAVHVPIDDPGPIGAATGTAKPVWHRPETKSAQYHYRIFCNPCYFDIGTQSALPTSQDAYGEENGG